MVNVTGRLAIAELVVYVLLLPFAGYILFRHGTRGSLGWGFFVSFVILRIVSSGMSIDDASTTGGIINSVGISSLLLAISGIIHEASIYTSNHRPKPELIVQVLLHILIATGIAISVVGASKLPTAEPNEIKTDQAMQEAGSLLLLLATVLLILLNIRVLLNLHKTSIDSRQPSTEKAGTIAIGALFALHFAAVRVIYGVIYAFTHTATLSPITGSFAVKLCLITLVQLGAALALSVTGWSTRVVLRESRSKVDQTIRRVELDEGLMK